MLFYVQTYCAQFINNLDDWMKIQSNTDYILNSSIDFSNYTNQGLKVQNCTISGQDKALYNLNLQPYTYNNTILTALFSEAVNVTITDVYLINVSIGNAPTNKDIQEMERVNQDLAQRQYNIIAYSVLFGYAQNITLQNIQLANIELTFHSNKESQRQTISAIFYKASDIKLHMIIVTNLSINQEKDAQPVQSTTIIAANLLGNNSISHSFIQATINGESKLTSTISNDSGGQLYISNLWLNVSLTEIGNNQYSLLTVKSNEIAARDLNIYANLTFKEQLQTESEQTEINYISKRIQKVDVSNAKIYIDANKNRHIESFIKSQLDRINANNVLLVNASAVSDAAILQFAPQLIGRGSSAAATFIDEFIKVEQGYKIKIKQQDSNVNTGRKHQLKSQWNSINDSSNHQKGHQLAATHLFDEKTHSATNNPETSFQHFHSNNNNQKMEKLQFKTQKNKEQTLDTDEVNAEQQNISNQTQQNNSYKHNQPILGKDEAAQQPGIENNTDKHVNDNQNQYYSSLPDSHISDHDETNQNQSIHLETINQNDAQDSNQIEEPINTRCNYDKGFCYLTQDYGVVCKYCYSGYTGEDCEDCIDNYERVGDKCVHSFQNIGVQMVTIIWLSYFITLIIVFLILKIVCYLLCCKCCRKRKS